VAEANGPEIDGICAGRDEHVGRASTGTTSLAPFPPDTSGNRLFPRYARHAHATRACRAYAGTVAADNRFSASAGGAAAESQHQVLKEPAGLGSSDESATCQETGLLQEGCVAPQCERVDSDAGM